MLSGFVEMSVDRSADASTRVSVVAMSALTSSVPPSSPPDPAPPPDPALPAAPAAPPAPALPPAPAAPPAPALPPVPASSKSGNLPPSGNSVRSTHVNETSQNCPLKQSRSAMHWLRQLPSIAQTSGNSALAFEQRNVTRAAIGTRSRCPSSRSAGPWGSLCCWRIARGICRARTRDRRRSRYWRDTVREFRRGQVVIAAARRDDPNPQREGTKDKGTLEHNFATCTFDFPLVKRRRLGAETRKSTARGPGV
jgi:hypothetical protein